MDLLPNQFALIGQNIRFDLGVDNGGGVYSEVSNDMVDVLFSKSFKKWQKQSLSYAGTKKLPNEAVYVSLSNDSVFPEILPQFDGNLTAAFGQNFPIQDLTRQQLLWGEFTPLLLLIRMVL